MSEVVANTFYYFLKNIKPKVSPHISTYTYHLFKKDFLAALTVSAILIPNTIGYAILTGLPPVMGLYAALPAVLCAALWGSSAYVVTAPVGVVSLLVASSLSSYAVPNTSQFITLAISLAVLVGVIQLALSFFRLGVLARLIPHSALIGFTNAAVLLIIFSQMPLLFGVVGKFPNVFILLHKVLTNQTVFNYFSIFIGVATICVILLGKKLHVKLPISLLIIIVSILLELFFQLERFGVSLIGDIPSGLPVFSLSAFSFPVFYTLLKQGLLIALVGFAETYSISKTLSKKTGESISADQELQGQGVANLFSGIFGGFPVSGSFSASALNYNSGAKTSMSGVFISFIILFVLFLLGPFLSLIPKPVLAGVIISAVLQLLDFKKMFQIYNISKRDGVIAVVTFLIALFVKPDDALIVGVGLGVTFFILRSMSLDMHVVGVHKIYSSLWTRESTHKEDLELFPDKLVLRLDDPLIFSNADLLEDEVLQNIYSYQAEFSTKIKYLVLNCTGVNYMDLSGIEALENLKKVLRKEKIILLFMRIKDGVYQDFKRAKLINDSEYIHGINELKSYPEVIS